MPVKDEEKKELTVEDYKTELRAKLNERYSTIVKRLQTETNIILRYELKVSLDELVNVFKVIFPEG